MMVEEKYIDFKEQENGAYTSGVRYRRTTAPLVADRDTVSGVFFSVGENGKLFSMTKSIEDERFPEI